MNKSRGKSKRCHVIRYKRWSKLIKEKYKTLQPTNKQTRIQHPNLRQHYTQHKTCGDLLHLWTSLVIYGHLWTSLVISGHLWISLVIYGYLWTVMCIGIAREPEERLNERQDDQQEEQQQFTGADKWNKLMTAFREEVKGRKRRRKMFKTFDDCFSGEIASPILRTELAGNFLTCRKILLTPNVSFAF